MTDGSLPEGLVERCAQAARNTWYDSPAMGDELFCEVVRAVLAVAAPALRAQALRDGFRQAALYIEENCPSEWAAALAQDIRGLA